MLGQALTAAYSTVEARHVHSLHAYFLRAGDPGRPILYEVDRSRDGNSFTSRRVVAIQGGKQIFHMSASFHKAEQGVDRQGDMPPVAMPETLPELADFVKGNEEQAPARPKAFHALRRPFEFRPAVFPSPTDPVPREPHMKLWLRAIDRLPDDDILHRCLLAYASDYYLLGVATMDARLSVGRDELTMASIDHAMWFHRPARADEWLLYVLDSPSASDSRGFARGSIFNRDGKLVASTAQEGLVRRKAGR